MRCTYRARSLIGLLNAGRIDYRTVGTHRGIKPRL